MRPHRVLKRVSAGAAAVAMLAAAALGGTAAIAAPGSPGVPQAPSTLVYHEDFENQRATNGVRIGQYTGGAAAATEIYVTSPKWAPAGDQCNGWVLNSSTPLNATVTGIDSGCDTTGWTNLRSMATAIGLYKALPLATAKTNQILSEYTNGGAAPGPGVEFQTAKPIGAGIVPGHFYLISAIYAAANCASEKPGVGRADPNLSFNLIQNQTGSGPPPGTGGGTLTNLANGLSPCTDPSAQLITTGGTTFHIAELRSAGFRVPAGVTSLGIQLFNAAGGFLGNDSGFDDPSIVDATPQLDKVFSPTTVKVGQTTSLTFTITNTDELQAKNGWSFSDTLPAGLAFAGAASTNCPAGVATTSGTVLSGSGNLGVGDTACTVTVPVTSATVGTFTNGPSNIGPISGLLEPGNTTVVFTDADAPAIKLIKSAGGVLAGDFTVGRLVTYSFIVTNTGNVPLTGVVVGEDTFSGTGAPPVPSCPSTTLAAGASMTCTATYSVTQADIDAGLVTNTATATGTPPTGADVSSASDAVITQAEAPDLDLVKTADASGVRSPAVAGDPIVYTVTARNTGNVTLHNVTVTDTLLGGTLVLTWPGTPGTLAPTQSVTGVATYTITQAEIDAGVVLNTANADGTAPSGADVPATPSGTRTPLSVAPHVTLAKSAAPAFGAPPAVGDVITYHFTITNDGDLTLHNVSARDELAGLSALTYTWPGATGVLAPTQIATATATYAITQVDIDAGMVSNDAIAHGVTTAGADTPSNEVSVDVPVAQDPSLRLVKTADASGIENPTKPGDTIAYQFRLTNTGNVTLDVVAITDQLTGVSALVYSWPAADGVLVPGQSATATATYSVTRADIAAGTVTNTATAAGRDPGGGPVPSNLADVTTPLGTSPALSLVKSATPADATHYVLGQQITYTFVVTNTGNAPVTGVAIAEIAFSGSVALGTPTCPVAAARLDVGDQLTCTAAYILTQPDIDAGQLTNTATATGAAPDESAVTSNESGTTIPGAITPAAIIRKTADVKRVTAAGQMITYTYVITNTGNVSLTALVVNETVFTGTGSAPTPACGPGAASLAPGARITCSATYVTTAADLALGSIANTATATGVPSSGGDPVTTDPSSAVVGVAQPAPPRPPGPLPVAGTAVPVALALCGIAMLGAGLVMLIRRRRDRV